MLCFTTGAAVMRAGFAVEHFPILCGTTVFVTTTLLMLLMVLLGNVVFLVFVFVGVIVVLPLTFIHTVDGGGWDWVLLVVVVTVVEVSVLVVRNVERVVEVTIVTYEAGVFAQRGISYATTCALLRTAAAFSRGDRWIFARAEVVAGGMQLSVVVTVVTIFLWIVRATGVEVTVVVVVLVLAVKVWVPVVQGEVIVAAGRTVSSISVAVCVIANEVNNRNFVIEGFNVLVSASIVLVNVLVIPA
jgi:hypothetical protein